MRTVRHIQLSCFQQIGQNAIEANLLWVERDTGYSEGAKEGAKAGRPKLVAVTLYGNGAKGGGWLSAGIRGPLRAGGAADN